MKKITLISLIAASTIFGANVEFSDANPNFNRINPTVDQNSILSYNSSIQKAKQTVVNISTTKTIKVKNKNRLKRKIKTETVFITIFIDFKIH